MKARQLTAFGLKRLAIKVFIAAIDVGGTFIDATALEPGSQKLWSQKSPTDPKNPAKSVIAAFSDLASSAGLDLRSFLAQCSFIAHGTTLALNALIEGRQSKCGLLCTSGFRDALEIKRSALENQWDFFAPVAPPLIPRHLRLGIEERIAADGGVVLPLSEESCLKAAKAFKEEGVEAVAICFLHSYINPSHEKEAYNIISKALPGAFVCCSHEVSPRIREYERASTTAINASLGPYMASYINELKASLSAEGYKGRLFLSTNAGGLIDSPQAMALPVATVLSGPAAGASGAMALLSGGGEGNIALCDMGGTSFDVHIIKGGEPEMDSEPIVAGRPISTPSLRIFSIGSGGGSIVRIGPDGFLKVGPDSQGSDPGPACYAKGGGLATLTDCASVLGLIGEGSFLGGRMRLRSDLAEKAVENNIAAPLGAEIKDAAYIAYKIASEQMADTITSCIAKQGSDPREFKLVSAGGAFPLFAANICQSAEIAECLVPPQGPVFCSWGMHGSAISSFIWKTFNMNLKTYDAKLLIDEAKGLSERAAKMQGIENKGYSAQYSLMMRYAGQRHELSVKVDSLKALYDKEKLGLDFGKAHEAAYGYQMPWEGWQITEVRAQSYLERPLPPPVPFDEAKTMSKRAVWGPVFGLSGEIEADIYRGAPLKALGPCIIELGYTNIIVPKGFIACRELGMASLKKGGA